MVYYHTDTDGGLMRNRTDVSSSAGAPAALLGLWLLLAACGGGSGGGEDLVPVWELGEPVLQIGSVDAEGPTQFGQLSDARLLSGGRLAVLDGGARELRYFAPDGRHIVTAGRSGAGPGEFRWPTHVFALDADSVRVFDGAGNRFSIFDPSGKFVRMQPLPRDSSVHFPLHIWLHERHLVIGGMTEPERAGIRATLDGLVPTGSAGGFAVVHATTTGELWIRDPRAEAGQVWHVIGRDRTLRALVPIPDRFDLFEVQDDAVVGRWRDENDVEFVRVYGLDRTAAGEMTRPSLLARPDAGTTGSDSAEIAVIRELMSRTLRGMVTAQELHYARHGAYTTDADSLEIEREELVLTLLGASRYGWVGVAAHPRAPMICAIAVGVSPGAWREGVPSCGQAAMRKEPSGH